MSATTATVSTSSEFPAGALYVGNLHPSVDEAILYEKFKEVGPLLSLQVCRDVISRSSLGYAYVNFHNVSDAERALDTMNFDMLNGQAIRIMWSQRDASLRKSGVGNLYIKNLDKKIDNKAMYDTFSAFGSILSCTVALDEGGQSKGYGFVHFDTEEAATKAITKVNGMLLHGKKVYVGKFVSRSEREKLLDDKPKVFYNLYVKNFGNKLDDKTLTDMFQKFGLITSLKIMRNEDGTSKGFGFVCYKRHESAEIAVAELNGRKMEDGNILYVGRALNKSERKLELEIKFEQIKNQRFYAEKGSNVYIKFLDATINDESLRKVFEIYGTITSAKVMMENNRSKGFGFVCYSNPDEAIKAVNAMHGKVVGTQRLHVALAQRKEDRERRLTALFAQRVMNSRSQDNNSNLNTQNSTQTVFIPPFIPQIRPYPAPRWPIPQQIFHSPPQGAFGTLQNPYRLIDPTRIGIGSNVPIRPNMRPVMGRQHPWNDVTQHWG